MQLAKKPHSFLLFVACWTALSFVFKRRTLGLLFKIPVFVINALFRKLVGSGGRPRDWSVLQDIGVMLLRYIMNVLPYSETRKLLSFADPMVALPFKRPLMVSGELNDDGVWTSVSYPGDCRRESIGSHFDALLLGDADLGSCVVLLYTHGGGYVVGSATQWIAAFHRIINDCAKIGVPLRILSVEYTLAPEADFTTMREQTLNAYHWLRTKHSIPPSRIFFGGDSAGGHLSLATVVEAKGRGLPLPSGLVLFSPWLDLTCSAPIKHEDFIQPDTGVGFARLLLKGTPAKDVLFSSLGCPHEACGALGVEVLTNLPPMWVCAGGRELLLQDSLWLCDTAEAAGVKVTREIAPDQVHVYPLPMVMLGVPEASAALKSCSAFIASSWVGDKVAE